MPSPRQSREPMKPAGRTRVVRYISGGLRCKQPRPLDPALPLAVLRHGDEIPEAMPELVRLSILRQAGQREVARDCMGSPPSHAGRCTFPLLDVKQPSPGFLTVRNSID